MPSIRGSNGTYIAHLTQIPPEKIFAQIQKTENGCWLWTGRIITYGYPIIFKPRTIDHKKSSILVHRWIYQQYKGQIPKGFDVHHVCNNKVCVNPNHLEALDRNTHLKKGNSPSTVNSKKTHCNRGHSLDNAYIEKPNGKRHCIICRREYMRNYFKNHKRIKLMGISMELNIRKEE